MGESPFESENGVVNFPGKAVVTDGGQGILGTRAIFYIRDKESLIWVRV